MRKALCCSCLKILVFPWSQSAFRCSLADLPGRVLVSPKFSADRSIELYDDDMHLDVISPRGSPPTSDHLSAKAYDVSGADRKPGGNGQILLAGLKASRGPSCLRPWLLPAPEVFGVVEPSRAPRTDIVLLCSAGLLLLRQDLLSPGLSAPWYGIRDRFNVRKQLRSPVVGLVVKGLH